MVFSGPRFEFLLEIIRYSLIVVCLLQFMSKFTKSVKCLLNVCNTYCRIQTRTNGTVTKGAVNSRKLCANLANTMDLHPLLLPTTLANFAQIRQISRKFGQFCFFPHFLDLHPVYYTPVCSVPKDRRKIDSVGRSRVGTLTFFAVAKVCSKHGNCTRIIHVSGNRTDHGKITDMRGRQRPIHVRAGNQCENQANKSKT